MTGPSGIIQQQNTLNRYLLYIPRGISVLPDVHSFTGEEGLSKPYRYTIRFTSPASSIAVNDVLNQRAEFILRAPNPKAGWHNQESWLPVRQINGVITSFARLKSSADEALYECVLEHDLALLDRNYRSAVYMNVSVPELVTKLMKESGHFQGYNIDFDQLSHSYPSREMIIQWKETDLQFIRRLLAEVGIWFRFENHDKVQGETVVVFGDGGRRYAFSDKKLPYVRHSGMTSYEEYITELEEQYELIPESVLVRTYNYRNPFSPQADKTIFDNDIPDGITSGKQYHYADHYLKYGDFYGEEAETATFYARLRYERLLNKQSVLGGTTSDPALLPGMMFHPTGDIPDGFKHGFLVTTMTLSGSRAQHYRAILKGIPYLNGYSYRPEYLPRPVIAGTVPGRVAAINRDHTYAGVDAHGRYRVKFDFDLDEKRGGFESALMRLGRPYGGDVFGFHFPLLDGTEVAVAFEGGDPDRPFIAHVMHDGKHPDLVTNRNDTRNVIRTAASNKIRLEDRRGQEHIKISTEYGKSQVSAGHLVDAEGKQRGEGVEARTDNHMALRAAKGVMITTEAQPRAAGKQLDMTAAIAQLEKALSLAMTLQQSALTAGASNVETDQQNQLNQVLSNLAEPGLLTYADKGQAHVTPDSLQLSAGKDVIVTAGQDTSVNVVKKFSLAVGEKLSLFARKLGIQMIAGAGDITTQAQRGAMHMLSQNDFTMASTDGQLNGSARQGIQLVCGGGGIRVSPNGLVTIFSPTGIELKGPSLKYDGPESAQVTVPPFNQGAFKLRYQLHAGDDPEQILANKKFRLTSSAGKVVEGITDSNGHSSLLDADDLDTYKMELME
ncbi:MULTISPECIES: type VI secretion system Vgr family protein [unclassified Enterobacter cloacae complex]|uniref:type VI secretion system Vgr family protein n=1 Tax=unclassified Enterobacter cloacae complex TaxID=2757714 RepID=UPI0018726857|nr:MULTISPECIES: type VI secretion system tip protein VgrG [unclassified Enterobacter cloacae complex]MBE4810641.1 type VI secretion system tip protein VgrG [Enterobacter cloacae complex sp. P44RS]MBE4827620.1 type VI secretion system tip protein VgrG [Enterobacter cloacae complex sp. P42RS]MBE4837138.1 type VI secretion system tip protein VgrG [Enterobacter cloacae complex sp. P46RS]MBE4841057.1 type VI secretion system tip protein VgrG [Enterobacter cloacae complex sp. P42C]